MAKKSENNGTEEIDLTPTPGLVTWSQGFSQRYVFFTQFFCERQDGMKQCAVPQCAPTQRVWRVRQGFPFHRWGSGGPPPGIFFANISSEKDILGQFSRSQRKKRLKKGFSQKLGRKGFCLQKKVKKRFKRFPREACDRIKTSQTAIAVAQLHSGSVTDSTLNLPNFSVKKAVYISWMKVHQFRLKFHWSLFRTQLSLFPHWFR